MSILSRNTTTFNMEHKFNFTWFHSYIKTFFEHVGPQFLLDNSLWKKEERKGNLCCWTQAEIT